MVTGHTIAWFLFQIQKHRSVPIGIISEPKLEPILSVTMRFGFANANNLEVCDSWLFAASVVLKMIILKLRVSRAEVLLSKE
jgi:hypothetical protein